MKKIIPLCLFSIFLLNNAMAKEFPKNGKRIAESQCVVCHNLTPAKKNKVGPYLFGVVGRVAGTAEEYIYSKMTFIGVKNDQDRTDIISYLSTLQ